MNKLGRSIQFYQGNMPEEELLDINILNFTGYWQIPL